jgi:ParB/RepB/Spo0J family partition protein
MAETITASGVARTIALSAITVREGFNPRLRFESAELERLTQSIRKTGVLQPVLVQPAECEDEFELVDGERRYRAALKVGLTEIPALIRPREAETGGLVDALAAHFHKAPHTPVEEAHAVARLLAAGLTRKGVGERLQVSRELVRERLEILELDEALHARVDDGTIPLKAIRTLVGLAKIDPGLPACALTQVTSEPAESWRRRVSWADVAADPIGTVTAQYADDDPDLPTGLFDAHTSYPLSAFGFDERGEKTLAALAKLNPAYANRDAVTVRFNREAIAAAEKLGAAHVSGRGHSAIIVGQEVADQLVADQLKQALKDERARARVRREQTATCTAGNDAGDTTPAESEERRRAERAAELEARGRAVAFNLELGITVVKAFVKVKLDARLLQVLSAVDFKDDLEALAMRGARYGFPGWAVEKTNTEKTKTVHLERHEATAKAHEYLEGAREPGEIAGRCLSLVVMAVLADERCLARSNRSMVSLHDCQPSAYEVAGATPTGLPWRRRVVELAEDLALERLPEHLTQALRDHCEQARADQEAAQRVAEADAGESAVSADAPLAAARLSSTSKWEESACLLRLAG